MSLSVTSVYPYFLISALLLGVGWAISRKSPFYGRLLEAEGTSRRFHPIDGLRGFLALGVFFHHAVISYFYYQHGRWEIPPSQFYTLLGQLGIALFFMITGFLFWTKGLVARPFLRAQPMFWSRLRRLVPMYLFSVACVFSVVAALTHFEMRQTAETLIVRSLAWLSFGFVVPGELNGLHESGIINASVQWTLAYEWMFYLFVPFGLIFARGIGFLLLITASAAYIQVFSTNAVEWNFLFGALAALLIAEYRLIPEQMWNSKFISMFVVGIIVFAFSVFEKGYGVWQAALLFCAFVCIASGNRLFGLLTCRAARLLGMISYSLYLMHAIVLFVTLKLVNRISPISGMAPESYWAIVAGCGIALVAICSVTYRLIEHPLMKIPMPGWLGGRIHSDNTVQGR